MILFENCLFEDVIVRSFEHLPVVLIENFDFISVLFWAQAEVKHPLFYGLPIALFSFWTGNEATSFFPSSYILYWRSPIRYFTLSFLLSAFPLPLCSSITQKGSDGCWLKWLIPKQCVLGKPVPFEPWECVVLWDLVREQKRSLGYCIISCFKLSIMPGCHPH